MRHEDDIFSSLCIAEVRKFKEDPTKSGRCKVRIYNQHNDEQEIKDDDLPFYQRILLDSIQLFLVLLREAINLKVMIKVMVVSLKNLKILKKILVEKLKKLDLIIQLAMEKHND